MLALLSARACVRVSVPFTRDSARPAASNSSQVDASGRDGETAACSSDGKNSKDAILSAAAKRDSCHL